MTILNITRHIPLTGRIEIYNTGVMQNANLAISGATDRLKYMVSTGYLDHKGILLNSAYNRLSLRANLAADITKWVDFGLNYSYTSEKYKSPPFEANLFTAVNDAPRWAPTEPVYDENGNYWKHRSGYGAPIHGTLLPQLLKQQSRIRHTRTT